MAEQQPQFTFVHQPDSFSAVFIGELTHPVDALTTQVLCFQE